MSDKPLVQQALANDIALLTLAVRPKKGPERPLGRVARFRSAMCYLRGFWEAVVREWEGLDRLRCVLPPSPCTCCTGVRTKADPRAGAASTSSTSSSVVSCTLRSFSSSARSGIPALSKSTTSSSPAPAVLFSTSDSPSLLPPPPPQRSTNPLYSVLDHHIPHSLCYHLADIYLAELNRALLPTPTSTAPLLHLLAPFYHTLALAPTAPIFLRISTNVFVPLFEATLEKKERGGKRRKVEKVEVEGFEGIVGGCKEGKEGKEELGREVLMGLFEEGGKKETNEVNRRKMYLIYREWGDDEE